MKLNISYVRPCGEKNKLTARLDFDKGIDMEGIGTEFNVKSAPGMNMIRFQKDNKSIMVSRNHIDIRNAESEYEILNILESIKKFIR